MKSKSFTRRIVNLDDDAVMLLFDSSRQYQLDFAGATPLVAAIRLGRLSLVKRMLDNGFSPFVNVHLCSALGAAIDCPLEQGDSILKLLLERVDTLEPEDPFEYCPELNEPMLYAAIRRRKVQAAKLLLEHGVDPNWMDIDGISALQLAKGMAYVDLEGLEKWNKDR